AAEKQVTGKDPEGLKGQRAPDPEQTVSQEDLADTGEKSAVQLSPAVSQEVNGSPSAQQDGGGDGKHADRGAPSAISLEKLTADSLDKVLSAVQSAVPGLDKDKAFAQIKAIPSFEVNHKDEVEKLKKEIQDKGLSTAAAQQILDLAKAAVPGLNDAKFMENI